MASYRSDLTTIWRRENTPRAAAHVVFFTLIVALATPALAQPRGRIIGSVEIPAIHDIVNKEVANAGAVAVALYSEPAEQARVVVTIRDRSEVESLEHGYEQISAAVLELTYRGDQPWYRVPFKTASQEGTAWLSSRDAGQFRFLHTLLIGRLNFMTASWDGVLYTAPSRDAPRQKVSGVRDRQDAVLAAMKDESGNSQDAWLLVVLTDGNFCDRGSRAVIAAGWIPAYSTSGNLTAWYYSRGC